MAAAPPRGGAAAANTWAGPSWSPEPLRREGSESFNTWAGPSWSPEPQQRWLAFDKATGRVWEDKQRVTLLEHLKDKICKAIIQWAGTWECKNQQGLHLKETDLEVMEQEIEYPFGQ